MNKGLLFEIQYDENSEEGIDFENDEIKNNSESIFLTLNRQ